MPHPVSDPTRLGTVEDVNGPRVSVKLADETAHGLLFVRGEGYRVGQVGSFVRIPVGYVDLYGVVAQVGAGAAPRSTDGAEQAGTGPALWPPDTTAPLGSRWLRVELVGEGCRGEKFERGISQYPSIGDSVHVVTESDLRTVYAPEDSESHVAVGRVASAEGISAYVDMNLMVSRHSAVVGSTGSGKSTAVASLLAALSDRTRFPGARVVLLDLHGEYAKAFGDRARVFRINAETSKDERELYVPFWALRYDEFTSLTMGSVTGAAATYFQGELVAAKRASTPAGSSHGMDLETISVDTPLPFCIHKLWFDLHCLQYATHSAKPSDIQTEATRAYEVDSANTAIDKGDAMSVRRPRFQGTKNEGGNNDKVFKSASPDLMRQQTDALEGKLRDPRLRFLFNPGQWSVSENGDTKADLDTLLASWLDLNRPITVFDLSGIPAGILDDLVGAMLRILYDAALWGRDKSAGSRMRPLLVVLEEAHVYLGKMDKDAIAKGRAAAATRQIAKEGRKYGVGLMIVSQRPSEIDSTILSQCGTLISLRLTNESDRGQIRACSSDNLEGLFAMLPILRTGEALIVGEAVSMPVRALINLPPKDRRPDSEDPLVVVPRDKNGNRVRLGGWTETLREENYKAIVEAWRRQDPHTQDKATTKEPNP